MLEIYRYVPPALLEGINLNEMEAEDFLDLLAKARYLEEVESYIIKKSIAELYEE